MVDFLKAAKNVISGKSPFEETAVAPDNRIDRIDQCKVVWYQWVNELGTDANTIFAFESPFPLSSPNSALAASRSYDISNHVESFSYSKDMNNASGAFSLVLENTFDWSRYMRPGQWICVYLAGDGSLELPPELGSSGSSNSTTNSTVKDIIGGLVGLKKSDSLLLPDGPTADETDTIKTKRRCLGIIQRVAIRSTTSVDGVVDVTYVVTGKDFGTIYEETELWFNANHADARAFESAINAITRQFARNLTELLTQYHSIFLNPRDALSETLTSVTTFFPQQWILPDQLVKELNLKLNPSGKGLFGDIQDLVEFNATIFENPTPDPLAGMQGRCWDKLKQLSQSEFHELFTELSDEGGPKIIFRPIPWGFDNSKYPTIGKAMLMYKDLANDEPVLPKFAVGTSLARLSIDEFKAPKTAPSDSRALHSVKLTAAETESFDIGPDYHSRANFFLVDSKTATKDQVSAFSLMAHIPVPPFPFRDENDIKRYGFRPMLVNVNSFNVTNQQFFGNEANKAFMLELNHLLRDFYSNSEDLYTGTIHLAAGKNDVKLGKVFVTDDTFKGISNMVFYIEGYTDNFSVNADGTCTWTQSINVTRGIAREALDGKSPKDVQPIKTGTFHVNENPEGDLDKVKRVVKNPGSIFK
jgi:hypothetical protein